MTLSEIRALPGPNVYSHRPTLVALIDLGDLDERDTCEFPGFADRLLAALPGLGDHHCGLGYPGGFVERLREGTYFGHVVEHVAIELQNMAGSAVTHGKTRRTRAPGVYRVVVEYRNEGCARHCLAAARDLVAAVLGGEAYPVADAVREARRIAARTDLGPSTRAIADAAARRGIPVVRLDDEALVQLGYGVHRKLVQAAETSHTSSVSVDVACDKARTKALLAKFFVPVPRGAVVRTADEAAAQLAALAPPLAVKPLDGNQGRAVSLGLHTAEAVREAFGRAAAVSPRVVVEEQFVGRDYRVLVVGGALVAASERVPASVVGDGTRTVRQLIERENASNPLRGDGHEMPLTRITVDDGLVDHLARSGGRQLGEVPAAGERVLLRGTANLSTGGTARDVTDEVHPDVRRLCERAARAVGLDVCGIDLIAPDIGRPLPPSGAGVIEVNAAPGLRMHHYPSEGTPRDAGGAVVQSLFPRGDGRIPVIAITGTNGKTTVTRMVAAAVAAAGKTSGVTTTDGIWVDGHQVAAGDMTGFQSARVILGDPVVEVAVLETARGGLVRRSIGYDWSDVGVITNVSADHLGQDGIETVDDLLHVKALVAERVRDGGTVVLNADDERLAALPGRRGVNADRKRVVFFTLDADNPVVRQHLDAGGTAFWAAGGWLHEGTGPDAQRLVRAADIPATLGGAARFQVANALAAAAAGRAIGLTTGQVVRALTGFASDPPHNRGRLNVFEVGRGHVLVDYGHNPAAFAAVSDLTRLWPDRRVTAVFTVPGDRGDDLIRESGRVVARGFDRLIIKEDGDHRGRRPGEVAELLRRAAHEAPGRVECEVVLDECEAVRTALRSMLDDEIVVVFYDDFRAVSRVLDEFGAVPDSRMPAPDRTAVVRGDAPVEVG
ncbi:cyanophycin synthetase [Gemmata sp.]|uniref:cyanophycin synthetase n=1 Tax=Gemmata sp. TaxID=1914242 RepID=UPI003F6F4EAE